MCLTIGNLSNPDDRVGILFGRGLKGLGVKVIEGGLYPENYLEKVVAESPDLVIIADAIRSDNKEDLILTEDFPADVSTSTHSLPLSTLASYLKARSKARVFFLGISKSAAESDFGKILDQISNEVPD